MTSDKKLTLRTETEWLDIKIIRIFAAYSIISTKVVARRLHLSPQRVYRAILRNAIAVRR